jgi:glycosyltransferase involved in cell wall biosynthesis
MNNKKIIILFWGPLGRRGQTTIGGGESGNRRTIDMISNNGIKVIEIPKPYPPKCKKFSFPLYFLLLLISITRFAFYCFKTDPRIDVAHVSAFYSHLVYFELLMMIFAKINRIPFVYEIRGGAMLAVYRDRSSIYRFVFDSVLRGSSAVFSQGRTYMDFIRKKSGKDPVFYPNYVDVNHLDYEMAFTRERSEQVGIIYFGRLDPEKGLEVMIRTCKELSNVGFNYRLHIIGDGPLLFKKQIIHLGESFGIQDRISFYPPMSFIELKKILLKMHFFLFPTSTRMEGHSNALTEAMAFGVVPICSDAGFNKSVIGPCGRILVADAEPSDYAEAIRYLWENGEWGKLSRQCKERIVSKFSSDIIIPRIIKKYNELVVFRG